MHRCNRSSELKLDALHGTAALNGVAFEASGVTHFFGALAKDRHVELFEQFGEGEQQDSFGDNDLASWQNHQVVSALVTSKVVHR